MKIEHSIEVETTQDTLWRIVSDTESEPEYWYGTKAVRTISREGDVVRREITQNFRSHKIMQKVVLHPPSSVEFQYLRGLIEGVKIISIETLVGNTQRLTARWDVRVTGVLKLLSPWIGRHIRRGTIDALERVRQKCTSQEKEDAERSSQSAGRDS